MRLGAATRKQTAHSVGGARTSGEQHSGAVAKNLPQVQNPSLSWLLTAIPGCDEDGREAGWRVVFHWNSCSRFDLVGSTARAWAAVLILSPDHRADVCAVSILFAAVGAKFHCLCQACGSIEAATVAEVKAENLPPPRITRSERVMLGGIKLNPGERRNSTFDILAARDYLAPQPRPGLLQPEGCAPLRRGPLAWRGAACPRGSPTEFSAFHFVSACQTGPPYSATVCM